MSLNKLTVTLLSTLSLVTMLQVSYAQTTLPLEQNNIEFTSIVNIVDPALVVGTEVLLKDLL
jgi:hypothetical protein